jgi:hypothetical protein
MLKNCLTFNVLTIISTGLFLTSFAFAAELKPENIENLVKKIGPGQYQGLTDEKKPCTVTISSDESGTSYVVRIDPSRGGGNFPAEFIAGLGMEGLVDDIIIRLQEGNHLQTLMISPQGANGYQSVSVINRIGADRSYGICQLNIQ